MSTGWEGVLHACRKSGVERSRREESQYHFVFPAGVDLSEVCDTLKAESAYLVTIVANDECRLEDGCFKLYYVFSCKDQDRFLILEYLLEGEIYPSIREHFKAAIPFELEALDLLGLQPDPPHPQAKGGFVLHDNYPQELTPLRANWGLQDIKKQIRDALKRAKGQKNRNGSGNGWCKPSEGEVFLPVGPIHAGVIGAGHFLFRIAGEVVDDLDIQLGFKHRGIEKLFQARFFLTSGWELAEKVTGDSSFAHSLAYCRAVEALAQVSVPDKAIYLRDLFLELERLYNHIGDSGALAHDVAFDLVASEIGVFREWLLRLNGKLAGNRLLRGINRPGGIVLPGNVDRHCLDEVVQQITDNRHDSLQTLLAGFLAWGRLLLNSTAFRNRAIGTGELRPQWAIDIGATGLIARASGSIHGEYRDFRFNHPCGVYQKDSDLRDIVRDTVPPYPEQHLASQEMIGDVFSRLRIRLLEVEASAQIVDRILTKLATFPADAPLLEPIEPALKETPNFEFALGHAEGYRGDVVYWLMKDKFGRIFRCKVRDPSLLNWAALRVAVIGHPEASSQKPKLENILADFPLINKSFNLSYAGHDL